MSKLQSVVVANFGLSNRLWPECLARSTVATYEDEDLRALFLAGDKAGYIRLSLAAKTTADGKPATKQTASTWYGNGEAFEASQGEVWLHRDGNHLWWTTTTAELPVSELRSAEGLSSNAQRVYVIQKPTHRWSKHSIGGRPLQWRGLHPKAHDFLQKKQGTMAHLTESNARYALALIHDESLAGWHSLPVWQTKAQKAGYSEPVYIDLMGLTAQRMVRDALGTVEVSNGQIVERVAKNKESRFECEKAFMAYVRELLKQQKGRCKLSGLPLQMDKATTDDQMAASLDRIDSNGHYEMGNLQVVCRFINFWKGASDNATFIRLMGAVQSAPQRQTPSDS
ncbi:MAG: hypothetical protein IV097_00475 [Burkholderiaceae bacterium]|nr:hypothetical protein [Burkholderiaceae bacterium]